MLCHEVTQNCHTVTQQQRFYSPVLSHLKQCLLSKPSHTCCDCIKHNNFSNHDVHCGTEYCYYLTTSKQS